MAQSSTRINFISAWFKLDPTNAGESCDYSNYKPLKLWQKLFYSKV